MVQREAYFDMRRWLDSQEAPDPATFLVKLQSAFAVELVVYLDGNLLEGRLNVIRLYHYPTSDHRRLSRNLRDQRHLPRLAAIFSALEPQVVDFAGFMERRNRNEDDQFLHQTRPAVVYPLLTRGTHHACLILVPARDADSLPAWRLEHDRDIGSLAGMFHARMMRSSDASAPANFHTVRLTRRERETLAWIAGGKSYWETAVILGITERTVRYFMANARRKLDVVNNAQAVAEAVWQGLIPRLIDKPDT